MKKLFNAIKTKTTKAIDSLESSPIAMTLLTGAVTTASIVGSVMLIKKLTETDEVTDAAESAADVAEEIISNIC